MFIENTIELNASKDKVWQALVDPAFTKMYMFGCEALSDWSVGSLLEWKGVWEGKEVVFVTGHIVEIEAPTKLVYTTFDPNGTLPDVPENHLNVTCSLTSKGGKTLLTVTQGDYSKVGEGQRRYDESMAAGGWSSILKQIKKLVE